MRADSKPRGRWFCGILAAAGLLCCASAFAAVPIASMSVAFAAPTGTVLNSQSIPVRLTLTNRDS
jgi:hypothetical protein